MRLVPIDKVKEGYILAKTIFSENGHVLIREGSVLNISKIIKIENFGYHSIYINDEYSTNYIEDMIDPSTRLRSVKNIRNSFGKFDEYIKENSKETSVNKWQLSKLRTNYVNEIKETASTIIDDLLLKRNLSINITDIKQMHDYMYQHSVNVAVLAVLLGIELGLNEDKLVDLAIASLLHDIGLKNTSDEILLKKSELTEEEFNEVKKHPLDGYEHFKDNVDMSSHIRMAVLTHHEWLDGSGYPNGSKGDKIPQLGRIIAVCDVYDALTSDRPYRSAYPPNEAIEYMLAMAINQLDTVIVKKFVNMIIPYPVGTLVKLSNNEVGVVESVPVEFPLRPVIKVVVQSGRGVELYNRDLMKERNILISGVVHEYMT
ncbi:MAG: HD-GYP domain-containing protein [Acidaminobacteraceae bacterium]